MNDVVWMYWENRPRQSRPAYLDLCIETVRRNAGACTVRLLDAETALEWLPDAPVDLWRGLQSPVHRSDYLRTRLLYHHGGLWADVDTIALRPLSEVTAMLGENDVVGWGKEMDGHFYSNFFASGPGSGLMGAWMRAQDQVLDRHGSTGLSYAELGQLVGPLSAGRPYRNLPAAQVAPVPWYSWPQFFSRVQSPQRLLRADPYVVVLWNKAMGRHLRNHSADALLEGSTLLSRLLRIGLHQSTPEKESQGLARLDPVGRVRFTAAGRRIEKRLRPAQKLLRRALHRGGRFH